MISRTWRGVVPKSERQNYERYIKATGFDEYAKTPGNRGAYLLLRDIGETTEFVTLTFWDSIDAIKAFAGEDYERSKYYPEDAAILLEKTEFVEHHEVTYDAAQAE